MPRSGIQKWEVGVPCVQHPDVPYRTQQGPSACFCVGQRPGHIITGDWACQLLWTSCKPSYRSSEVSVFKQGRKKKKYNHLHSTGEETSQVFSWCCLIFHLTTTFKIFFSPFGEIKGQKIINIKFNFRKAFFQKARSLGRLFFFFDQITTLRILVSANDLRFQRLKHNSPRPSNLKENQQIQVKI